MLDVFNTIVPSTANYQEFYYGTSDANRRLQTWNKPRGVSMIRFLLIGAGGGGANGNAIRSAGGGSGVVVNFLIPAMFVPDRLLIVVGAGGAGGAQGSGSNSGGNGTLTEILINTSSGTPSQLFRAQAGGGGTTSGGSAGVATQSSFAFLNLGISSSGNGQAGGNPDTAVTASATGAPLTGGAGGSSTTTGLGTSVTPLYGYPVVNGGATSGAKGEDGYFMTQPLLFGCGGAGGAGNASGVGGAGGIGGIGCGGGGGGVGSTAGGAGGRGGNGAVFIWAW